MEGRLPSACPSRRLSELMTEKLQVSVGRLLLCLLDVRSQLLPGTRGRGWGVKGTDWVTLMVTALSYGFWTRGRPVKMPAAQQDKRHGARQPALGTPSSRHGHGPPGLLAGPTCCGVPI